MKYLPHLRSSITAPSPRSPSRGYGHSTVDLIDMVRDSNQKDMRKRDLQYPVGVVYTVERETPRRPARAGV